jgi:plastocyanin
VTADTNSFASGNLQPGGSFSFTFTRPGTYAYHCSIHPSMHGSVVVG